MRLIDADRLIDFLKRAGNFFSDELRLSVEDVIKAIENEPTIELLHKTGTWERIHEYGNLYACSECGFVIFGREEISDFCPSCGADMIGGKR